MSERPPIPPRLAGRPCYGGMPIPWTVYVDKQGVPDFKVISEELRVRCARERRCGLCGEPLGHWIWFIGGELTVAHRLFFDPPMHEQCARYAQVVCPFIASATPRYSEAQARSLKEPDYRTVTVPMAPVQRMYVMKTRGFDVAPPSPRTRGSWAFGARPWAVVEEVRP